MSSLLTRGPAIPIPNFQGYDLTRHDSVVAKLIALNAGFAAAIAIIISLRLYVRLRILRRVWADDILMFTASFFTIALCVLCIVGTKFGLGRHEWDLNPATVIQSSKSLVQILLAVQVMYATAVTATKASIIASYLRILPQLFFQRLMYIVAFVTLAMWVCSVLVTIFQCSPVRGAWDFTLTNKKCIPILEYFYVAASINIASDFLLSTSPLPLLWKLSIPLNERIILCMLFGCGLFATAASAMRLSQLHKLNSSDLSFAIVSSLNWSLVEVGTGIICACIPSIKPIVIKLSPGKFCSLTKGSKRSTPRTGPSYVSTASSHGPAFAMGSYSERNAELSRSTPDQKYATTVRTNVTPRPMRASDEEGLVYGDNIQDWSGRELQD